MGLTGEPAAAVGVLCRLGGSQVVGGDMITRLKDSLALRSVTVR
jgi:hypothetical protein